MGSGSDSGLELIGIFEEVWFIVLEIDGAEIREGWFLLYWLCRRFFEELN